MMSLVSLSLFASVCPMLEPIRVMRMRLHIVARAECETRPILSRAGGSHCVFVVCPAGSVPQHAATFFVLLSVSLSSGCAAFGREPLCASAGVCVLTLSVRVCACPASRLAAPLCPISLSCPPSCRRKPDLGHWGQRTGCGPQWVSTDWAWLG